MNSFKPDQSFKNYGLRTRSYLLSGLFSFLNLVWLGDFGISVIFIKSIPVSFAKKLARQNFLSLLFLIKYTDFVKNKTSLVYKLFDVQGILIIRCRPYPLYYYQKLYSFLSDETFETISYFWVDD